MRSAPSAPSPHQMLARVVRSGFVEGEHHGSAVALGPDGAVVASLGDPTAPVFPRSSNKPMQAVGMLRAGLDLDGHLLALASSSHSGEAYHRDGVRRILAGVGLGLDALDNTPDLPLGEAERLLWQRLGRGPEPLAQNCSGKHAGMLATCVVNGWPVRGYRDPGHPVQQRVTEAVADLCGEEVAATGVDGCGAPVLAVSLVGLARGFARIASAGAGGAEHRVAQAIRTHPEWLGGTGREVTALLRGVPGLVAKDGAEGVVAAALPDGRAVAVKIADGADRARWPVTAALLRRLGVEAAVLDELAVSPVLGAGHPVGQVEAVDW